MGAAPVGDGCSADGWPAQAFSIRRTIQAIRARDPARAISRAMVMQPWVDAVHYRWQRLSMAEVVDAKSAPLSGMLVFVYGTLKRGHGNHHWMAGAAFLGEARLPGAVLHDLGPFPMAIRGDGVVWGEVYGIDANVLSRLDGLEGYPRLYERHVMALADGRRAWVYLGRPRQVRFVPRIEDGLWRGRDASQR
jgi:gamma-glutamylcyclotransferase (GGCT)/AIG2-like uncharacterized protein YtfP